MCYIVIEHVCFVFVSYRTMSPLAELYSTSTLEHHHFDQCIMILSTEVSGVLLSCLLYTVCMVEGVHAR